MYQCSGSFCHRYWSVNPDLHPDTYQNVTESQQWFLSRSAHWAKQMYGIKLYIETNIQLTLYKNFSEGYRELSKYFITLKKTSHSLCSMDGMWLKLVLDGSGSGKPQNILIRIHSTGCVCHFCHTVRRDCTSVRVMYECTSVARWDRK